MAGPWENYGPAPKKKAPQKPALRNATPQQRQDSLDALRKSDALMNENMRRLNPEAQKQALATYYADPRIQRLRQEAGLPAVRTRKEEIADIARRKFQQESTRPVRVTRGAQQNEGGVLNWLGSLFERRRQATPEEKRQLAGAKPGDTVRVNDNMGLEAASTNAFGRALFGIPERVIAAVESTPDAKNYDERLQVRRAVTDMQRKRSTTGDVLGTVAGSVAGGAGANAAVRGAGSALTRVGASRAGNIIQSLATLEQGQRGRNAAKIVLGGAAGGAAQAAGEGSDVTTGAATGAIAAPLVVGGAKAAEWASRPVKDFLRASSARGILRRYTSANAEDIARSADEFRQRTGREPTVFEVLPVEDRQNVQSLLRKMPGSSRERATGLVRERVNAMPGELSSRTAEITAPQQRFLAREMARELATSRGATNPTADELALAQRAVRDPTDLEMVRQTVSRNIMAPYDDQIAYQTVDELLPAVPVQQNGRVAYQVSDEGAANAIRSVAGTRSRNPDGITVRDMTDMLSDLRTDARAGGIEGRAAQRAADHLEEILARDHPDAADAMGRMTEAHAARSRMLEGAKEGRATRLRENVPVTGNKQARLVRNAYDTPEGAAGRATGQRAELMTDFESTPSRAISRARDIAESPGTQEAIRRNLGDQASQQITDMSAAQSESLRRMGSLLNEPKAEAGDMDFGDLAMSLSLLSPTALLRTKSQAVTTLLRVFSGIPENRANQIVEALFSREPGQMSNALRMLNSAGERGSAALRDIIAAVASGAQGASVAGEMNRERADSAEPSDMGNPTAEGGDIPPETQDGGGDSAPGPWDAYAAEEGDTNGKPYGRAVVEALFPGVEVTEDLRDPNSKLGRENPNSYHVSTDGAVDVRPIPGMTFEEFVQRIRDEGYDIVEAIDEVKHPSRFATGPHWHVVFA